MKRNGNLHTSNLHRVTRNEPCNPCEKTKQSQEIKFKEDVVWISVTNGETDEIGFIARGNAKMTQFVGLDVLSISNVNTGQSKTTLQPLQEDLVFSMPIRIGYRKIYLAAEFQARREVAPELNAYDRVDKKEE